MSSQEELSWITDEHCKLQDGAYLVFGDGTNREDPGTGDAIFYSDGTKLVYAGVGNLSLGTQANTAGSGIALSNSVTTGLQVLCDDGGAAITSGNAKAFKGRFLITVNPGDTTLDGILGQVKFASNITASADYQAGVRGYVELVGGNTVNTGGANANIGAGVHGVRSYITLDANATIATGHYVCGVGAHLSVKSGASFTTTGVLAAFACFADDQAGGATATQKWQYGLHIPFGTATTPISVGLKANAVNSGITIPATDDWGAVRVFTDDNGANIGVSVRGLQSRTLLTVDQSAGTIRASQGHLKMYTGVDVTTGVYTALQGYLEMAATHVAQTGAVLSAIDASAEIGTSLTIDSGGRFAGIHVETTGSGTITNNGTCAGVLIDKATGAASWPVGIQINCDSVVKGIQVGTLGSNITSGVPLLNATSINGFYSDDNGADQTTGTVYRNVTARTYFSVDQTAAAADYYVIRGHLKAADLVDFGGDTSVKACVNGYAEFVGNTVIGAGSFFASVFGEFWGDGNITGTGKAAGVMSRIYTSAGTTSGTTAAFMATKHFASTQNWPYGLYIDSATVDIRLSGGPCVMSGTGSPNGSVAGTKGSIYLRSDNSSHDDTVYCNTDGGTTWAAIVSA